MAAWTGRDCRKQCLIAGGVAGVLVFLWLLSAGGLSFLAALVLGGITGWISGGLLFWAICEGRGGAIEDAEIMAADWAPEPFITPDPVAAAKPATTPATGGTTQGIQEAEDRKAAAQTAEAAPPAEDAPALSAPPKSPAKTGARTNGATPPQPAASTAEADAGPDVGRDESPHQTAPPPPQTAKPAAQPAAASAVIEDDETDESQARARAVSVRDLEEPAGAAAPDADAEAGRHRGAASGRIEPLRRRGSGDAPDAAEAEKAVADEAAVQRSVTKSAGANGDAADDLTQIKGVGPKLAASLHEIGVTRLAQIAAWGEAEIEHHAELLGRFGHRIRSDDWVAQAQELIAAGKGAAGSGTAGKDEGRA